MKTLQIALLSILAFALIALAQTGPGTSNYPVKNGSSASFSSVTITPKCAATGTNAVNCGSYGAGSFSCSATSGTCTVTDSAVTATSVVIIEQTAVAPPSSGVTCGTNFSGGVASPTLATVLAGTFSIYVSAPSSGVNCYQYAIF